MQGQPHDNPFRKSPSVSATACKIIIIIKKTDKTLATIDMNFRKQPLPVQKNSPQGQCSNTYASGSLMVLHLPREIRPNQGQNFTWERIFRERTSPRFTDTAKLTMEQCKEEENDVRTSRGFVHS